MSVKLLPIDRASGPAHLLRNLDAKDKVAKFILLEPGTNMVLDVLIGIDAYEKAATDVNVREDKVGVVVVLDSDEGFPISNSVKWFSNECVESVKSMGDYLFDCLYRSDNLFASLICDEESCCPSEGKPFNEASIMLAALAEALSSKSVED